MTRKALILMLIIIIGIVAGSALHLTYIFGEENNSNFQTNPPSRMWLRPRNQPWALNLTDAQREEIQQLVQEMRRAGSNQQEIREEIDANLEKWGIKIPEPKQPPSPPWLRNLTDAEKEEIQQLIRDVSAKGAGREGTRNAVNAKLAEWGVKAHEAPTCKWSMRNQTRTHLMLERLTEDQRDELHQKIWELKQSGASQEETGNMLHALLEAWE
ncbi:MAG: hypothetical protein QXE22_07655 [Candidatus Bathyarchaeia archaeon]